MFLVIAVKKVFRYIFTGYIFSYRKNKKRLNNFIPPHYDKEVSYSAKIAIYTIIIGNYDGLSNPLFVNKNADYYVITDSNFKTTGVWKKIDVSADPNLVSFDNVTKSRYYKFHPEILFKEYEYSVYIDGNIIISGDINPCISYMNKYNYTIAMHTHSTRNCIFCEGRAIVAQGRAPFKAVYKQLKRYKKEGMPLHYGLFENNIIVRKHNDNTCQRVMNIWGDEFSSGCKRDQLSFMYSLWRVGLNKDYILSMGSNSRKNPLFVIRTHS